jgi:drug/metabolite transporter (DMT)-like permease
MQPALARAALLLTAAMACFSVSDVLAKQLSAQLPPVVLAWCRYLLLLVTVLPIALLRPATFCTGRGAWQAARAAGLVGSAVLFLFALQALPVAEATAMVFASPLFVTLLAALILRERVPMHRWATVALGFAGVLIVVRPGIGVFGGAALFPLLSSLAWACAVICTRKLSAEDSSTTTTLYSAVFGTGALSLMLPDMDHRVLMAHALPLVGMAACWCGAQWLTISAYRIAPAASIAPYAYTQLVWASLLGVLVFMHVPDTVSLAGMAVIITSGLLAWRGGRSSAG